MAAMRVGHKKLIGRIMRRAEEWPVGEGDEDMEGCF